MSRFRSVAARALLAAAVCAAFESGALAQLGAKGLVPIPRFPQTPARNTAARQQPDVR